MVRFSFCIIIGLFEVSSMFGQLFSVGTQHVDEDEFVRMYEKNVTDATYAEQSLRDYLDRFIVYKLKIEEAFRHGIDTLPHVRQELRNHAEQLAQPYLTDKDLLEKMLKEVYSHISQDVHARQIMVRCSPYAKPQDTLEAYKIALRIRDRLVKGENFDSVAQDESQRSGMVLMTDRDNHQEKQVRASDLRYFSAFAMPYNIEKYAFSAPVGEFSMPLHTTTGYHIVEVLDRQPTLGKINASQIFVNVPRDATPEQEKLIKRKVDSLYFLITNGNHSFEDVAHQHSDDKTSAIRGGRMAEFNVARAEPVFISHLYKMPLEVVSRPFRAEKGYYIVVIHSISGIDDYETLRSELQYRLQRDERAAVIKQSFVRSLLKDYPLVEIKGALKKFASTLDSTEVGMFWSYDPGKSGDSVLCKVGHRVVLFQDLGKYVEDVQADYHPEEESFTAFIERSYRGCIAEIAILCETDNIGKKHAEFNRDYNEYRDGILTFEITDRRVWGKSASDTAGLYAYYDSQKHCYLWPARVQALVFRYDVRRINTDDVQKFLVSSYRKRLSAEQIVEQAYRYFDPKYISVTINVYEKGQNKFVDRVVDWNLTKLGLSRDVAGGSYEKGFVYIYNYYPPTCKSLEDVRGIMVSQFQAFLEKEWVDELRAKYKVTVNDAEFQKLIKK